MKHEQDSYEANQIDGKTIHTWIICVPNATAFEVIRTGIMRPVHGFE